MKDDKTDQVDFPRRRFLIGTSTITVGLGLTSLLPAAQAQTPKHGGKFVYTNTYPNNRMGDATNGRHPYHLLDLNTRICYDALAWVDPNFEVVPELATAWESDATQKIWDITLRQGVRFQDGRDMTADDVVASYEYHQQHTSYAKHIIKVEKTGSHRVRMTLDAPNSEFPYTLGEYQLMIMQAAPPDSIGMNGIGTGPFKIVSLDPRRRMILERNPYYWRKGLPYLDRIEVVNTAGKMETAINGFRSGLFDAVLGVDPGLLPDLKRMPDTHYDVARSGDQALMILPKNKGSVFEDKRIRKALALAIDTEKVMKIVYDGKTGWIGNDTHLCPVNAAFIPPFKRDVAKAKALLAEAGHPNGITLPTFYFAPTWPEVPRVFQVIAQSVKEAGITLPIEQRPSDGYRHWRVKDHIHFAYGPVGPRNAGISLFRMRPDYNESGYWKGPACDEYMKLYYEALAEKSLDKRRATYMKMQQILHEEVPAILPAGRRNTLIYKPDVNGLKNHSQFWSIRFDGVWKT